MKVSSTSTKINRIEDSRLNLQGRLLVTRREAMSLLGIQSRETIIRMELDGSLRPVRLTERGRVYYQVAEVEAAANRTMRVRRTGSLEPWERRELSDLGIL